MSNLTTLSALPEFNDKIQDVVTAVENGDINGLDAFIVFKKLEDAFKKAKAVIEEHAYNEADKYNDKSFTINGFTITKKEGSQRLQYNEDELCLKLSEQLKERQELVKLATKSKSPIYDNEGVEVPRVSVKFDKSSLIVK